MISTGSSCADFALRPFRTAMHRTEAAWATVGREVAGARLMALMTEANVNRMV
jgi:hypothetical protein